MIVLTKRPFEEVEHNPESPLPSDHINLLADLLRYCAEVTIAVYQPQNEHPPGTELAHEYVSAFGNAVGILETHGLVIQLESDAYRLAVPCDRFQSVLLERHQVGKLKFDDFNRALEAPYHLSDQTDVRASKATVAHVIEGLRKLGLVDGPPGASKWADKALKYVWFSAYGAAVEATSYSGDNEFERFYNEAR